MSNDANQIKPQEFKLAVIGIRGSGKTTMAAGLYGRNHERHDYCETLDDSTKDIKDWCNALKEGKRLNPTQGDRQQIKMRYHYSDKDQYVLDFFDYRGEESSAKDSLEGLIKRVGCVGVVILVNPMHFLDEREREKNETLICNVKEILKSATGIEHAALVMTASDWFGDHKEKQNEIQKWFDGLRGKLEEAERDVRDFKVTVYGTASNGEPHLSDDNNAYEPFRWIVDKILEKKNKDEITSAETKVIDREKQAISAGKRARWWKRAALAVGLFGGVSVAIGLVCYQNKKAEVDQREKDYEKDKGENTNKIAQLEKDVNQLEVAQIKAKAEAADRLAKAECSECLRAMTEKLHSRYGVAGVVDCFNTFCSEHPGAVNTPHAEDVVQFLHKKIGGEFMRIYADITNQVWQVAINQASQIASRDLDASFNSLKEFAAKVCKIKHLRAKESSWYEFAEKCKKGLTSRDEAFVLQYEVTKIEVMMEYGEVSKRFGYLELDAPIPVKLTTPTNEIGTVRWEKTEIPLEIDKAMRRIATNKVWQTIWNGALQMHGNPWRDAGLRMTIKDKAYKWTQAKMDFVISLYGDRGDKYEEDGTRVLEKRIRMPLKENSNSKDPYVRIRVHVKDLTDGDSVGKLFSLMPKDAKLERP